MVMILLYFPVLTQNDMKLEMGINYTRNYIYQITLIYLQICELVHVLTHLF